MQELTDRIVTFLRDVGISVSEGPVAGNAFLPGVRIQSGTLVFDRRTLAWPGDLLHEAGHIAVTPAAMRDTLSDELDGQAADAHGGEAEATAWAYAASVALGLEPSVLFHSGGYHGNAAGLILTYTAGVYPGCAGLVAAGMTLPGNAAAAGNAAPYPNMLRWLRA